MTTPQSKTFDAAIVGGGPAGLSAAIWLARYLHSVVLVDSGDPRNWQTRGVHGYLGLPDTTPPELRGSGRDEARGYGVTLIDGCVGAATKIADDMFQLLLEDGGTLEARRVLIAIGIKDIWPDVSGLEHCYGETAHHCPDCDGYETRGRKTVVIASGRKAVGMALALRTWTRDLIICTNGVPADIDEANLTKLDTLNIPVIVERIAQLHNDCGEVRALELESGLFLDCDRIFFAIGHYPADDLGAQLGCERDDEGLIVVDNRGRTSVQNVFAAGDIVPGPHLAISAAAEGAIAAMAIHRSLLPQVLTLE